MINFVPLLVFFRYSNFLDSAPSSSQYTPPVMTPTSHQQGNQYTSNISKVGYSKLHGNWTVKLPDTKAPASDGDQRPVPVIQIKCRCSNVYMNPSMVTICYDLRVTPRLPNWEPICYKIARGIIQGKVSIITNCKFKA